MGQLYFAKPANTIEHNGKEIGTILKGDTQTVVNEKLAQEIEDLKKQISTPKIDSKIDSSSVVNNSGFGQSSNYLDSGKKVKVQVTPSSSNIGVFYDLSSILEDGWSLEFARSYVEGNRNGLQTVIADSNKTSSGFVLSPNNFPATIDFEARIRKGDIIEVLTTKQVLHSTGDDTNYTLYKKELGNNNLTTQKDVNDTLYRDIQNIKKALEPKTVKVGAESLDYQGAILALKAEIDKLRSELTTKVEQ
jgi:hypothetical protein